MQVTQAKTLVTHIARLTELAAEFHSEYGRDYRVTGRSPQAAQDLLQATWDEQCEIALLLSPYALQNPHTRWGNWWERRDVIDSALINEMALAAFQLVARCTYARHQQAAQQSILVLEQTIAGMLHPHVIATLPVERIQEAI